MDVVGTLCGSCGTFSRGLPDFCGCRARFDRGAPHAVALLVVEGASISTRFELRGAWEDDRVRALLGEDVELPRTRDRGQP